MPGKIRDLQHLIQTMQEAVTSIHTNHYITWSATAACSHTNWQPTNKKLRKNNFHPSILFPFLSLSPAITGILSARLSMSPDRRRAKERRPHAWTGSQQEAPDRRRDNLSLTHSATVSAWINDALVINVA